MPIPSFVVPEDKIKALFKSGLPIRYTGTGANPYLDNHDEEDARGGAKIPKGKRAKKVGGAPVVPAMGSGDVKYGEGAKAKAARVGSKETPLLVFCDSFLFSSPFPTLLQFVCDNIPVACSHPMD